MQQKVFKFNFFEKGILWWLENSAHACIFMYPECSLVVSTRVERLEVLCIGMIILLFNALYFNVLYFDYWKCIFISTNPKKTNLFKSMQAWDVSY